jgi:hypothetical protein
MKIPEVGLQVLSVGAPSDTIDSSSRFTPQSGVGGVQEIDGHMVRERREPLFRPLSYGLPYAIKRK